MTLVPNHRALADPCPVLHVGVLADHTPPERRLWPDVRVVEDDRPVQERPGLHHDVRTDHRVAAKLRAPLDPRVRTDEQRSLEMSFRVDLGSVREPQPAGELEGPEVEADLSVEDVAVDLHVGLDVPDVRPRALGGVSVHRQSLAEEEREQVLREVEFLVTRDELEDLGLDHVDAGVDLVAEDLAPAGLLEEALDPPLVVGDHDPELERILHSLQRDRHRRLLLPVEPHHFLQVDVGDGVPGDHEERVVEEPLSVLHAARSAERLVLSRVGEREVEVRAVAEEVPDDARQKLHGHDDVGEPVAAKQPKDVLQHGFAHDRQHRFRLITGQRTQAGALAPRHHHGFHAGDSRRAAIPSPSGVVRLYGGRAEQPSDVADIERRRPVVLDDADGEEDPADRLHRGREGKSEVPPGDHRDSAHEDECADLADVADVEAARPRTEERRPDDDHPDVADEDEQRGPQRERVTNDERHERRRDGETVGSRIEDLAELRHAVRPPGDVAVHPIGRHHSADHEQSRELGPVMKEERDEDRDQKESEQREQIGDGEHSIRTDIRSTARWFRLRFAAGRAHGTDGTLTGTETLGVGTDAQNGNEGTHTALPGENRGGAGGSARRVKPRSR